MTLRNRPTITVRLKPQPTYYASSNEVTNRVSHGNKALYYVFEQSTGVRRRKPKGWKNPTAYTFTRREFGCTPGTTKAMPTGYPSGSSGTFYEGAVFTVPGEPMERDFISNPCDSALNETTLIENTNLRNAALIVARNKLKSSNVDLGIAYAERKQTSQFIGDTLRQVARSFTNLKRGNVRKAMNDLGITSKKREPMGANVPQKWLELQYAAKPLYSDIYGACDSLATKNKDDWRVTATATRRDDRQVDYFYGSGSGYYRACDVVTVVKQSVFVRIDALPVNEVLISLSSLGLLNPLSIAWEKTYLSFVVDWALPIGNFFDSLDAMVGYKTGAYSSSLLTRADWGIKGRSRIQYGAAVAENKFSAYKKLVYLNRQVSTSVPLPSLPSFKDPRSLGHLANSLALLATAFGRR